jgi:hypothetical protein
VILLSTTGTPTTVVLDDLNGIQFNHPIVDFQLDEDFTREDIVRSTSLASALDAGEVTLKDDQGLALTQSSELQRLSVSHTLEAHPGVPDATADGQVLTVTDYVNRVYSWSSKTQLPGDPRRFQLGTILDYTGTGSADSADAVQYTQVFLDEGDQITDIEIFPTLAGNGDVVLGLYDQADPEDFLGEPRDRVATTAVRSLVPADEDAFVVVPLTTPYTVPTTGYYWLAFTVDSNASRFVVSATYPADYADKRVEMGAGGLPATASGLTNPSGAIALVAGIRSI